MTWCDLKDWAIALLACASIVLASIAYVSEKRIVVIDDGVTVCADGAVTSAKGHGACSHHGGVAE